MQELSDSTCSVTSGIVIHEDGSCGKRMVIKMGDNSFLNGLLLIRSVINMSVDDVDHLPWLY